VPTTLLIRVAEDGGDQERIDEVARLLRGQLNVLDEVRVVPLTAGVAPAGARGIDVAVVGALVATVGDLSTHVRPVIAAVRHWLDRTPHLPRRVRIELDGDVLELANATPEHEEQIIDLFVSRHTS